MSMNLSSLEALATLSLFSLSNPYSLEMRGDFFGHFLPEITNSIILFIIYGFSLIKWVLLYRSGFTFVFLFIFVSCFCRQPIVACFVTNILRRVLLLTCCDVFCHRIVRRVDV